MPELPASYASPNLRWALLLEDHPGAVYGFALVKGKDLPDGLAVPEGWGGENDHCLATITFPPESGKSPAYGAKDALEVLEARRGGKDVVLERTSELWTKLTTMTLGRALKRAGYPDDLPELKALVLWRQRKAEVAAIAGGPPPRALPAGETDRVLEEAAKADPEHVGVDDTAGVLDVEEEDGPRQPTPQPVQEETALMVRQELGQLGARQKAVTESAKAKGITVPPRTQQDALALLALIKTLEDPVEDAELVAEEPPKTEAERRLAEQRATLAEILAGLTKDEWSRLYDVVGGLVDVPVDQWPEEQVGIALEWAEGGT